MLVQAFEGVANSTLQVAVISSVVLRPNFRRKNR